MSLKTLVKPGQLYKEILGLLFFTLPLSRTLTANVLVVFILLSLINGLFFYETRNILNNKAKLFSVLFYFVTALGILYSENSKSALFDISVKLSFLLLPLSIATSFFTTKDILKLKKSFIAGCAFAVAICLANSTYHYYLSHQASFFYYTSFSSIMHSSYFAMYLSMAMAFILFDKVERRKPLNLFFIFWFVMAILLCSSRAGLLGLLLILVLFLFNVFSERNWKTAVISVLIFSSVIAIGFSLPGLRERLNEVFYSFTIKEERGEEKSGTYKIRTEIWKNSVSIIKKNPFLGVGNGDVNEELKKSRNARRNDSVNGFSLNAHNQFIQSTLSSGILGAGVLLSILIIIFGIAWKQKDIIIYAFLIITIINFLFESVLETQAGVVFFVLFYSLFSSGSKEHFSSDNIISEP